MRTTDSVAGGARIGALKRFNPRFAPRRYLKTYGVCVRIAFSTATAYRASFVLSSLITLVGNLAFPLITVLIYGAGASFPGWSAYEVLLIQSVVTLSSGFSGLALGAVTFVTMDHVREGTFETVLLKPMHPLLFIVLTTFEPENIGLILGGGVIFGIAAAQCVTWSFSSVVSFLVLFIAGFLVMAGISLIMAATSFKWVGNSRLPEIASSVENFGRYPLRIFPVAVRSIVTFVIPVAMVGYYPAQALLGRGSVSMWASVPMCVVFFGAGVWLYNHMIRNYQGVGG